MGYFTNRLSLQWISLAIMASLGATAANAFPIQAVEDGSFARQTPTSLIAVQPSTIDSLLQLTNQERSRARLGNLSLNSELSKAAQRHADDMARSGKFSHRGSNGSTMGDRIRATNYRYRTVGENLFMQAPRNQPAVAVKGWMESDGHRENILNGQFTEIGLGYASAGGRHYYVQVFGRPLNAAAAVRPSSSVAQSAPVQTISSQILVPPAQEQSSTAARLLALTNQARGRAGLGTLNASSQLNAAAQKHADDMAQNGKFSHTGSNGSSMGDRIKAENYRFRRVAENIAYRGPSDDPEGAIESWLKSQGHRENMLNRQFTDIGLGYATDGNRHYYVQVFGTPR